MSLVSIAEVRALVQTGLSDADLQAVIDREEAFLARRVGLLSGPRTVTVLRPTESTVFRLLRPATTATVTDNGVVTTVALIAERYIERVAGYWIGPVAITYTPTDAAEVKRVVIELVRLALSGSTYASETIGDYSYTRDARDGAVPTVSRAGLIASLLPKSLPQTVAMTL